MKTAPTEKLTTATKIVTIYSSYTPMALQIYKDDIKFDATIMIICMGKYSIKYK